MGSLDFLAGQKTGRNWKLNYVPGGPAATCQEGKAAKKEWLDGFYDGLKKNRYKQSTTIKSLMKKIDEAGKV